MIISFLFFEINWQVSLYGSKFNIEVQRKINLNLLKNYNNKICGIAIQSPKEKKTQRSRLFMYY